MKTTSRWLSSMPQEHKALERIVHSSALLGVVGDQTAHALGQAMIRKTGLTVFCGPPGNGKATLSNLLIAGRPARVIVVAGDLRSVADHDRAFRKAAHALVVATMSSGESYGVFSGWRDMGFDPHTILANAPFIVTLRRLPAIRRNWTHQHEPLVVEVIDPNGCLVTPTLADQARVLVKAGCVSTGWARNMVPGFL